MCNGLYLRDCVTAALKLFRFINRSVRKKKCQFRFTNVFIDKIMVGKMSFKNWIIFLVDVTEDIADVGVCIKHVETTASC